MAVAYETAAIPMVKLHADDDLVISGHLAGYKLKEISDLSSLPVATLALELVKLFAEPDTTVPASVWLGLARFACDEAQEGQGQAALKRLLGSEAAKLSSSVQDGEWREGLYPANDMTVISSGLVWRMLGSPSAADRWRAAHCIRCFARFERWDVVDALVAKIGEKAAGPFGAPELPFYFMHAELWLLVALARIALDSPKAIARYKDALLRVVLDEEERHVLMRHFAAKAILACAGAGACKLPKTTRKLLENIDQSPYARLPEKLRDGDDFYRDRPPEAPKPKYEFHLDYDFHKYDVQGLAAVFGKGGWEVHDLISDIVRSIDPDVTSMYESGGRERSTRNQLAGMTSRYHTYGQQLGWHALFLAAGPLLKDFPVTDDRFFYDDPWGDWFGGYLLTREDGLWLSDGMDWAPPGLIGILLEKGEDGLVLTGDTSKLLALAGLDAGINKELIVAGDWHSTDDINVRISSALIKSRSARAVAKTLIQKEPMHAWLPVYGGNITGDDYLEDERGDAIPWIVQPSGEARLDGDDPLGSIEAARRPRIANKFASKLSLRAVDPFGRVWKDAKGRVVARSAVWGRASDNYDDSGVCLYCSAEALKDLMTKTSSDLVILIVLRRYEKGFRHELGKYTHSVGVVRITKALDLEYYKGRVNHVHKHQF